jgi:NTP pyrophosphatase (non-canonical NTP hydrolase)
MTLLELTQQARSLRARFDTAARQHHRPVWTRSELMQGFVGDVGDLTKLVMAKENLRPAPSGDLEARLEHELADCLWSVLVLADEYGVDLSAAFAEMITKTTTRLSGPGFPE